VNHQPFLASLQSPVGTASFASSLPVIATAPATSPWSPQPTVASAQVDVSAFRAEAIASGRAEGLRETEALRAQLAAAVAKLDAATSTAAALATAQIAEAATAIVEAWLGRAPAFQPIVAAWLARTAEPTTARVHPADVAALATAVGEAAIRIVPDATVARGDLHLRAAALELDHKWAERLAELRTAIHAAVEGA
jgi:flagellar biosynthesis/type III secretory pathway protein FliH